MTDDTVETSNVSPIKADNVVIHSAEPAPAAEPVEVETAAAKLRAFEDDVFGKDANRINGEVERGIGSPYAAMTPHQKAHHAALEQLVAAEKKVADASAELASAQVAHDTAMKAAAAAEEAAATSA